MKILTVIKKGMRIDIPLEKQEPIASDEPVISVGAIVTMNGHKGKVLDVTGDTATVSWEDASMSKVPVKGLAYSGRVEKGEFTEELHPRGPDGKFAPAGSGGKEPTADDNKAWVSMRAGTEAEAKARAEHVTLPSRLPDADKTSLRSVDYGRKIDKWEHAPKVKESNALGNIINKLPSYDHQKLYGKAVSHPSLDTFKVNTPQFFVLDHEKKSYLINTEGYDYARYVARIR